MPSVRHAALAFVLVLPFAAGCQKGAAAKKVHPVRGQVRYQNQPVPDCLVVFYPLNAPDDMERPQAYTDANGNFEVTARRNEPGAAEGAYSVVLLWRDRNDDAETGGKWKGPNKLPAKYGTPGATDLRVEVKPGANDLKPFELQ